MSENMSFGLFAVLFGLLCVTACFTWLQELKKDARVLRQQRDAAHGFLQSAESYSMALEKERLEIRKVVGAKIKERTVDAVRRKISEPRLWS